jgi:bifunctional non-homologous end joining protein LigD
MPITPMRLLRIPDPFDHPDFIFEPKIDGFRALAYVEGHRCRLVSRNGHEFKYWPRLAEEIAHAVHAKRAVLDGEVCCLNPDGRSNFNALLFRREWPYFYAFDILSLEGKDLTALPLLERKRRLRSVLPKIATRLLYLDHIEARGTDLYSAACARDVEGVVAKWARGSYQTDGRATSWLKIKNPEYSGMVDRHELFAVRTRPERERVHRNRPELALI